MTPIPLKPIIFPPRAFTVAEARANGVTEKRLRAAMLHRSPLPLAFENGPLHVSVPRGRHAPHRDGVHSHQIDLPLDDVDTRFGFAVTTPERTWCDLGALVTLARLVAVGDRLIHRSLPLTRVEDLTHAVEHCGSARGARLLRQALPLLDAGSESPMESWQRVIIVLAGLPTPVTNYEVFDERGVFVARVDLAYPELKISMDYEGDHHRSDQKQWRRDLTRFRRLKAIGWDAKRYTVDDLESPQGFIAELEDSIAARS